MGQKSVEVLEAELSPEARESLGALQDFVVAREKLPALVRVAVARGVPMVTVARVLGVSRQTVQTLRDIPQTDDVK